MKMKFRNALVIILLCALIIAIQAEERIVQLVNNYRNVQDMTERRALYRSNMASGSCLVNCIEGEDSVACFSASSPSSTSRIDEEGNEHHWSYADQGAWWKWHDALRHEENECLALVQDKSELHEDALDGGSRYLGESPISIDPSIAIPLDTQGGIITVTTTTTTPTTTTTTETKTETHYSVGIWLSESFKEERPLTVKNNGHALIVEVCGENAFDCKATANFGSFPKALRKSLSDDESMTNQTYYLKEIYFHWGDDNSKGAEHIVCNSVLAGEAQFLFELVNFDDSDDDGSRYVILSILLKADGAHKNEAFAPIFDVVHTSSSIAEDDHHNEDNNRRLAEEESHHVTGVLKHVNESAPSAGYINLHELLPETYETKYYTYAGSLTSPPCSHSTTWFVFEDAVPIAEFQLDQIRESLTVVHEHPSHSHSYQAVLYPFVAIAMGTLTQHLISRFAPSLPYTMIVMIEGFLLDLLASINNEGRLNSLQESLRMWSNIDGHLLLYAFLPALLFGDVMSLNTHVFEKVFWQAVLLAGPGVLLGAAGTGLFIKYILPYDWSFSMCMTLGSVLAATDPVAVVALLKAVGASAKLTMVITGESLLNDGTAMVLFTIFFDVARSDPYSAIDVVEFFARMVFVSALLGTFIGGIACYWMQKASSRHSESDIIVQLAISLCCAYLSFFLGESTIKTSGILTTVASGLILAWRVWPVIVDHSAMEHVWHAIEYLGNTLIFSLAGVLTRRACFSRAINRREYFYLFILYFGVVIIRGVMMLLAYPLLTRLSDYGATPRECAFMVWGGLRGAVGLALAVFVNQVLQDNNDEDDNEAGERFLFFVAGIALLTLVINAPSSGAILRLLKLVGIGLEERDLIKSVRARLSIIAQKAYAEACLRFDHDAVESIDTISALACLKNTPAATPVLLLKKTHATKQLLLVMAKIAAKDDRSRLKRGLGAMYIATHLGENAPNLKSMKLRLEHANEDDYTADDPATVREMVQLLRNSEYGTTYCHESMHRGYEVEALEEKYREFEIQGIKCDPKHLSLLREAFLRVLKSAYWDMIEDGELPRRAAATLALLHSVEAAIDDVSKGPLNDYIYLKPTVEKDIGNSVMDSIFEGIDKCLPSWFDADNELHYEINYRQHEIVYYALRAFVAAHHRAQIKIAQFFGGGDDLSVVSPTSPVTAIDVEAAEESFVQSKSIRCESRTFLDTVEEVKVVLESAREVHGAVHYLENVSPKLKAIVKSNIISEFVIEAQHESVHTLIGQGILTQVEAEAILEDLHADEQKVKATRRARTHLIAKLAVDEKFQASNRRRSAIAHTLVHDKSTHNMQQDINEMQRAAQLVGQLDKSSASASSLLPSKQKSSNDSIALAVNFDGDDETKQLQT
uniref:Alpha-carbonic anhydrase domain-containing protein n=1 Tax=Aureoumbra lagunensis TaxID=44058 RepID=A0A7S3NIQ1_9STRA|mmetsp:Transcript_1516/g.2236  ORF Transcript_1516/g.2236 Transcript_1516/m.2236 type:complete len:1377 (+) Transcript_1516:48-4178(+)